MIGKKREKLLFGLYNLFLFFFCKRYKYGIVEVLVKEIDIEVVDLNYILFWNLIFCELYFYGLVM